MYIHDYLINAKGSQKYRVCLFDLSAAFDTIDHNILSSRLSSWFGITGSTVLDWFKSYLSSRPFRVNVKVVSLLSISVLWRLASICSQPLDFIMYTTPLSSCISSLSQKSKSPFCTPMIRNFSFPFILQMFIRA